jgi:type IV pilus assembly protein PilW
VGPSGRKCGSADVPSLYRISLADDGKPVVNELLPGIEHFQVQYGINDQYLNADDLAITDWPNVITARIWLLVRSECSERGYTDGTNYVMGDVTYTPNDTANNGHRRQLYSSVVMIRN